MKKRRFCRNCGQPEKTNGLGYSNLSPYSQICVDCINRARPTGVRFLAIRKPLKTKGKGKEEEA